MADPITIVLLGEPAASGRPRFTRRGIAYTPEKTKNERAALRLAAQEQMNGAAMLEGPLALMCVVERRIPITWSRKRQHEALLRIHHPITRPDYDNYLKNLDALTSVVWHDDAQICRVQFEKRYGAQPKIVITVSQI